MRFDSMPVRMFAAGQRRAVAPEASSDPSEAEWKDTESQVACFVLTSPPHRMRIHRKRLVQAMAQQHALCIITRHADPRCQILACVRGF